MTSFLLNNVSTLLFYLYLLIQIQKSNCEFDETFIPLGVNLGIIVIFTI